MSTTIGNLAVVLSANAVGFSQGFAAAQKTADSFIGTLGMMARSAGTLIGVGSAVTLVSKAFTGFTAGERSLLTFEALLGSADKAKEFKEQLKDWGDSTSFGDGVGAAAKELLKFNVGADEVLPSLKKLGDIAAGVDVPLQDLAKTFSEVKYRNELTIKSLDSMTDQGIPFVQELMKTMNLTEGSVLQMVKEGKVGFAEFQSALGSATSEGGRFYKMTEKSANLTGSLLSRIADQAGDVIGSLGSVVGKAVTNALGTKGILSSIFEGLSVAENTVKSWAGSINSFAFAVVGYFSPIVSYVTNRLTPIWEAVSSAVGTAFDLIGDAVSTTLTFIGDNVIPVGLAAFDALVAGFELGGRMIQSIWEGLGWAATESWAVVEGVLNAMTGGTSFFADLSTASLTLVKGAFDDLGQYIGSWQDAFTAAFKSVQFVFENFGDVSVWVLGNLGLKLVNWMNDTVFMFTDTIPRTLSWLQENWFEIFRDIAEFTSTVFSNLGKNIWEFVKNIPGLIAGTVDFSDIWKPLTDGFKATIKTALVLPERELTDFEKRAGVRLENLRESLAQRKEAFFAGEMGQATKKATDWINAGVAAGAFGGLTIGPTMASQAVTGPGTGRNLLTPDGGLSSAAKDIKRAGAFEVGSKEAYNVMIRSRDVGLAPAVNRTAKAAEESSKSLKQVVDLSKQILDNTVSIQAFPLDG